jgi:hypothetical protein
VADHHAQEHGTDDLEVQRFNDFHGITHFWNCSDAKLQ